MKDADKHFSRWIRERDPYCLFKCGRPSKQNSHFWGRGNKTTRFDPENCDGVCGHCHLIHEGSKQGLYRELKIRQLGKKRYDALEKRARSNGKLDVEIRKVMDFLSSNKSKINHLSTDPFAYQNV